MYEIKDLVLDNYKWIFSGIGVFILGLIITRLSRSKIKKSGDTIVTHGTFSPGKVQGDYKVKIDEKKHNKG